MPADVESDDVEDITMGKYVWLMAGDSEVKQNSLGEVVEVDGTSRGVKFGEVTIQVPATQLDMCSLQKGTYVYPAFGDQSQGVGSHHVGAVAGIWRDDTGLPLLHVQFGEKAMSMPPDMLMKCEFQPGTCVYWTKADSDVPPGHTGEILDDLGSKTRPKVLFPNGTWRFKGPDLLRTRVQPGHAVYWIKSDDDVPEGTLGEVKRRREDSGRFQVEFPKGSWSFKAEDLRAPEIQVGCWVTWHKSDEDIPEGTIGKVTNVRAEKGGFKVRFPAGSWNFKVEQLRLFALQPGDWVTIAETDGIAGGFGEVLRVDDQNMVEVKWLKGVGKHAASGLQKLQIQKYDRVQLARSCRYVKDGDIGVMIDLMWIVGDDEWCDKFGVQFSRYDDAENAAGAFLEMKADQLKKGMGTERLDKMKANFKNYDQNGDGRLSEGEFLAVLTQLGLSEDDCKVLFKDLDRDGDGKLSCDEFLHYVFGSGGEKEALSEAFLGEAAQPAEGFTTGLHGVRQGGVHTQMGASGTMVTMFG
eukprot:s2770_g3.t1